MPPMMIYCLPSLQNVGTSLSTIIIGQVFCVKGHSDIDLGPDDLNIKMGCLLVY